MFTPHVPAPLLRAKFTQILTLLAPSLTAENADASLLRSSVGSLESLLIAQDAAAWSLPQTQTSPRAAVAGLLTIAQDPRPKVRKRALDALAKVLRNGPPSPSVDHPAADLCAETALAGLKRTAEAYWETATGNKKRNKGHSTTENARQPDLMHALQLVRGVALACNGWPSRRIDALCETLLAVSRSSSEYLTMAAFEIFEAMFAGIAADPAASAAKMPRLLEVIGELKPSKDDAQLLPPWIAVLARAYDVSGQVEPEETFMKLPDLFKMLAEFLASHSENIRTSASECMVSFLATCVPDSVILEPSIYDEKTMDKLGRIINSLLNVKYQASWKEVFIVISAAFDAFRWRSTPLLDEAVKTVGDLRSKEEFNGKKEADAVLGKAIEAMGPNKVLKMLPLNISRKKPTKAGQPGRAWFLPILRDSVINTDLQHFRDEFVPLSEELYQKVMEHEGKEKTMEIKIYETLVQQIWALLPGYCTLTLDITFAFDQVFAEQLANLLYHQTDLRSDICRGLQLLVDSNKEILAIETEDGEEDLVTQRRISKSIARKNLDHLAGFAENLLAVLFNVYSQTLPQFRAFILQCINAYLSITPEQELKATFERVVVTLGQALEELESQTQADKQKQKQSANKMPPTSHTLMDLVITLAVHLPRDSYSTLFAITSKILPQTSDPQLQKKAYKLIPRLSTCPTGITALQERNVELQQLLLENDPTASAPARRDRLDAISVVVQNIPDGADLHFIPAIIKEVVIAAKEVNEKARTAAFDLLVLMGEKFSVPGSTVVQSKIPGMPADAPNVQANLEEFFTMVGAGLASEAPHTISATIAALTRILYEFHSRLDDSAIVDLFETMDLFLRSNNREIVRSVLGFVKVATVSLPDSIVQPRLPSLVEGLVRWSHEHKARFRSKVKHILERLIRRYGDKKIEKLTPEADRKLIANIRKTKERNKRKKDEAKAGNGEDGEGEASTRRRSRFESEYDQAVYGSESEDSDEDGADGSDDEMHDGSRKGGKSYIIEDEDEPLDLLGRNALGSISSTKPVRFKGLPTKRTKAKTDLDGKLILGGEDDDEAMEMDGGEMDGVSLEKGINAYVDAIKSRKVGQKGKIKFSNKRDDDEDMEVDEEEVVKAMRGNRQRSNSANSFGGKSPRGGSFNRGRGSGFNRGRGGSFERGRGGGGFDRGRGGSRGRVSKAGRGGGGGGGRPPRRKL